MQGSGSKVAVAQRKRSRDLLVQALYQWLIGGADAGQIEAEFRADNGRKNDWDFFHDAIDALFKPFLDRDIAQLGPIEAGLLRLGSYELSQRIEVPYRVVINEYVELAKKYGASESHRFVNGILDKVARQHRRIEIAG